MSIGLLQTEADLQRFIDRHLDTLRLLPVKSYAFERQDSGLVSVEYPGASNESEVATVSHNLGVEPITVLFTAHGNSGIRFCTPEYFEEDKDSFKVHAFCSFGEPEEEEVSVFRWVAVA